MAEVTGEEMKADIDIEDVLPPIPCAGGCGQMLRSRYVYDWCGDCFSAVVDIRQWPSRPPLRVPAATSPARMA